MDLDGSPKEKGNTKERLSQRKKWFFTWNNYPEDARTLLLAKLSERCSRLVFQSEVGETGTPHVQGAVVLKKPMRWSELGLPKTIHWELTRNEDCASTYCLKTETFDGKFRYEYPSTRMSRLRDHLTKHPLRPYQAEVEALYHTIPDDRTIHWYWEPTGHMGKSWFMKYMAIKYPGTCLGISCAKSADIVTMANEEIEMYIFDFPRSSEGFAPYNAMEQLKNGYVCDGKLKKKVEVKIFPPPHIVCFANWPPDKSTLSADRWKVTEIAPIFTDTDYDWGDQQEDLIDNLMI